MSLGLAITLPDGVVLIADGRQSYPQAKTPKNHNCIDKIQPIGPSAFAIPFGVTQVTDHALQFLREKWLPDEDPSAIAHQVDFCVKAAWALLQTSLAPDVDKQHITMKAALVVGGLSKGRQFVVACLHGAGVQQKPLILQDIVYQFILYGGENYQSNEYFKHELQGCLENVEYKFADGPLNAVVDAVISAGESVIRHIETLDSSIGGTIRFAVLRAGFPPLKERIDN